MRTPEYRSSHPGQEYPAVLLSDHAGTLVLTTYLPDIREEQIHVYCEPGTVLIEVSGSPLPGKKTIRIPAGARLYRKTFSSGLLTLMFEKG